jgi:hypothetical protein
LFASRGQFSTHFRVPTQKDPAHAAGSSSKRVEQGEMGNLLLVVVVMRPVVMKASGIGRNDRAGQNRKCKESEQQIAEHLHKEKPLHESSRPIIRAVREYNQLNSYDAISSQELRQAKNRFLVWYTSATIPPSSAALLKE